MSVLHPFLLPYFYYAFGIGLAARVWFEKPKRSIFQHSCVKHALFMPHHQASTDACLHRQLIYFFWSTLSSLSLEHYTGSTYPNQIASTALLPPLSKPPLVAVITNRQKETKLVLLAYSFHYCQAPWRVYRSLGHVEAEHDLLMMTLNEIWPCCWTVGMINVKLRLGIITGKCWSQESCHPEHEIHFFSRTSGAHHLAAVSSLWPFVPIMILYNILSLMNKIYPSVVMPVLPPPPNLSHKCNAKDIFLPRI